MKKLKYCESKNKNLPIEENDAMFKTKQKQQQKLLNASQSLNLENIRKIYNCISIFVSILNTNFD